MMSTQDTRISKYAMRAGWAISALATLLLLADAAGKLVKPAPVVEAMIGLGYDERSIVPVGVTLLACVVLYAIPRTSVLGAVLLTGFLGGAVATHVRAGSPLLTHTLFPVYVGAVLWAGLYARDARLRRLLPLRAPALP